MKTITLHILNTTDFSIIDDNFYLLLNTNVHWFELLPEAISGKSMLHIRKQ